MRIFALNLFGWQLWDKPVFNWGVNLVLKGLGSVTLNSSKPTKPRFTTNNNSGNNNKDIKIIIVMMIIINTFTY